MVVDLRTEGDSLEIVKTAERKNARLKKLVADPIVGQRHPQRGGAGKLLSPAKLSRAIKHVRQKLKVSQRRARKILGQPRSTQRHIRKMPEDEEKLVERTVALAGKYGRYGYRRITALLREEGFSVNHKRVERIWRQEGLKVPQKQPKRKRL